MFDPFKKFKIVPVAKVDNVDQADQMIISELQKFGADLAQPRSVRYYLYFKSENKAIEVCKLLNKEGFQVEACEIGADQFRVLAVHLTIVNRDSVTAVRMYMTSLCKGFDGEYDGWEASPKL